VEVREKIAERVKKSCEASAWQRAFGLGKALATLGETLALVREALALQEVAGHCRETLGGLRMEGLGMGCLGVVSLGVDGLGMGVKGMGCLGVDNRLGVLCWEGGRESGKVVESWSREAREGT